MEGFDYLTQQLDVPPVLIALVSLFIALLVFALTIAALVVLRGRKLPPLSKALWAVLIVMAPFMGSLAFLIVRPEDDGKTGLEG